MSLLHPPLHDSARNTELPRTIYLRPTSSDSGVELAKLESLRTLRNRVIKLGLDFYDGEINCL